MKKILILSMIILLLTFNACQSQKNLEKKVPESTTIKDLPESKIQECEDRSQSRKEDCYYQNALKKQNTEFCDNSGKYRITCYAEIIMKKDDFNSCDSIGEQDIRDSCFYYLATDYFNDENYDASYCSKIEKEYTKDACYMDVALLLEDTSICGSVVDNDGKDACYADISIATLDISGCNYITESNLRELCEETVSS